MVHQFPVLGDQAADARAAGGKALGYGVDDDDIVCRAVGKFTERLELLPAVDELAVGLVADEEEVVLLSEVDEHLHLGLTQHHAGGVAGVRDHDGAGVSVDERLDLLAHGVAVALLGASGNGRDGRAAGAYHGVVVGIKRLRNENFVAVVENALERDLKRLAAAGGDVDLTFVKVHVELVVIVLDRVDQLRDARRGRIGQHRLLEMANCLEERGRGLHVGLTDVEVIDVDAACLGCHRVRVELAHWRQAAFFNFTGKLHRIVLLLLLRSQKARSLKNIVFHCMIYYSL